MKKIIIVSSILFVLFLCGFTLLLSFSSSEYDAWIVHSFLDLEKNLEDYIKNHNGKMPENLQELQLKDLVPIMLYDPHESMKKGVIYVDLRNSSLDRVLASHSVEQIDTNLFYYQKRRFWESDVGKRKCIYLTHEIYELIKEIKKGNQPNGQKMNSGSIWKM
jgi:hypothetical protein